MPRAKEQERVYRTQYRKRRYLHGKARVDATGTRRRLQALMRIGWSGPELSRRAGRDRTWAFDTMKYATVMSKKAEMVKRIYDELWDKEPPRATPAQRHDASYAQATARKHGWVPPLAWDDDTIDDPEAVSLEADPATLTYDQRVQLAVRLVEYGATQKQAAKRCRLADDTIRKMMKEMMKEGEAA